MAVDQAIERALALPGGARFYRAALQVNPFAYCKRHNKSAATKFSDEAAYNAAVIDACLEAGIEIVAVTDHYRIKTSSSLAKAATDAGLHVFPGFEAETKDGKHLLVLFDPGTPVDSIDKRIGYCDVIDDSSLSPQGKYDVREMLEEFSKWDDCVIIAPHVTAAKGLLDGGGGQARASVWTDPKLIAVGIAGRLVDVQPAHRPIIENTDPAYRRDRPVAVINCGDVCDPDHLRSPGSWTWIKMSEISVQGLRQAFLDPGSRIRLSSDAQPDDHAQIVALAWETEGFLRDCVLRFNENLNVLIGGRGTGKSTITESIRYTLQLEPVGDEARRQHEAIIKNVVRAGTRIVMLVRSCQPDIREYLIERTVPNPAVVRDRDSGKIVPVNPRDVCPNVEVYGQHEISEIAASKTRSTHLLERFIERVDFQQRKTAIRRKLERSRQSILEAEEELVETRERLAQLPMLEETLKRYETHKLEEKLKTQSQLDREEQILETATERLEPLVETIKELGEVAKVDRAFLSAKAVTQLPNADLLGEVDSAIVELSKRLAKLTKDATAALSEAQTQINATRAKWGKRRASSQKEYDRVLRELQKSKIDGAEFLRLRRTIEALKPLRDRESLLAQSLEAQISARRSLLADWESLLRTEFQELERGAKKVNKRLRNRVEVVVEFLGDKQPIADHIQGLGGRSAEARSVLAQRHDVSPIALANAIRDGKEALAKTFGVTATQAKAITDRSSNEWLLQLEELQLHHTTSIRLNVGDEASPLWRTIDQLSTGQKATAILLILLLESDAPLLIDQPEDDLDNRFISEAVVTTMRDAKRRRQFIFATHNANIPILGDAEMILGLSSLANEEGLYAQVLPEHVGSIDKESVRQLASEVLEGGKAAFEMRQAKYGF